MKWTGRPTPDVRKFPQKSGNLTSMGFDSLILATVAVRCAAPRFPGQRCIWPEVSCHSPESPAMKAAETELAQC